MCLASRRALPGSWISSDRETPTGGANPHSLTHLHKRELTRELARLLAAVVETDRPGREA